MFGSRSKRKLNNWMISERLRRQMCTHIRFKYYRGVSAWPGSDRRGGLLSWFTGWHWCRSHRQQKVFIQKLLASLCRWHERSLRVCRLLLPATGPSLHLRHDIMSHSPFCGFGSAGIVPLAPWRVLLGQTPNPPSGPSTGSKLPPSQLSELVGLGERNTRSFRGIPH